MSNRTRLLLPTAILAVLALTVACAPAQPPADTASDQQAAEPADSAQADVEAPAADSAFTGDPAVATSPATRTPAQQAPAPAQPSGFAGRSTTEPMAKAAPAPAAPKTAFRTLGAGETFPVALIGGLSTATNHAGDSFQARVTSDVVRDGLVVVPAGTLVHGSVVESVSANPKIGGRAKLVLAFDRLELPFGQSAAISASYTALGKSETKKDAATIAGSAAGGALLGRMINKDDEAKGTLVGAAVGAAAGTAIAAKTDAKPAELTEGTAFDLILEGSAKVPVRL